jgi:hypothetical protein
MRPAWLPAALWVAMMGTAMAGSAQETAPAATQVPAQPLSAARRDSALRQIQLARKDSSLATLPPTDSFSIGGRVVSAGSKVGGTVAVADGDLEIFGLVDGNAVAFHGDVIVHKGGVVTGDAISVLGQVRLDGGTIRGEMRSLQGSLGKAPERVVAPLSGAASVQRALKLALGWLMVLMVIGIGVLVFASSYLDGVVQTLEQDFSRAFWYGLAGEVALLPVLALLLLALVLSIIGILLIPFAVVAYAIAAIGVLTLGFLAMSQVTGRSLSRSRAGGRMLSERGASLRGLVVGLVAYFALWMLAAAFSWQPAAGTVLRGLALAVTYVAATAGFGAAILSRAGTRREAESAAPPEEKKAEELSWQTPTPVTGVVAARRPTPASYATKEHR